MKGKSMKATKPSSKGMGGKSQKAASKEKFGSVPNDIPRGVSRRSGKS